MDGKQTESAVADAWPLPEGGEVQKSQKVLIGAGVGIVALAVAVAFAGPVIYRDFIAPPAADAPSLKGTDRLLDTEPRLTQDAGVPDGEPLDAADLDGAWSIADGSEAGYRVDEVLNGTDVTVTGRTDQVDGALTIAAEPAGLALEAAEFEVDVASITTDSSQRDAYFRDRALIVEEHPTATFRLAEPVTLEVVPASGEVVQTEAQGELTLAGSTQAVTAMIEVSSNGEIAAIAGTVPITFADFGIEAPSLGFVQVEPTGYIEFQLTAVKQ